MALFKKKKKELPELPEDSREFVSEDEIVENESRFDKVASGVERLSDGIGQAFGASQPQTPARPVPQQETEEDWDAEEEKLRQKLAKLEAEREKIRQQKEAEKQQPHPQQHPDEILGAIQNLNARLVNIESRLFRSGL